MSRVSCVPKIRHVQVEVRELRYSQLSCKETFQCGRSVSHLNSKHRPCRSLAPFFGASRVCCDVIFDRTNPRPAIYRVSTTKVQQTSPWFSKKDPATKNPDSGNPPVPWILMQTAPQFTLPLSCHVDGPQAAFLDNGLSNVMCCLRA